MGRVEIRKVESNHDLKTFVQFYYDLYRDCPHAVPFLFTDEIATLRKDKNPAFEFCEADFFLAYKEGKVVGRVAAILNKKANQRWNVQQVRFGYFDFIDDLEVSKALMDTVEQWGREKGMTQIAGPLGFTDMDREGMMVEGFDRLSTMYVNYNYPYYPQHIEKLGRFEKDNDYLEFLVKISDHVPEKIMKVSQVIEKRYNLRVKKFTRKELVSGGKGREIFHIINKTYDGLYGFSQLSERQIDHYVDEYIKIADLDLVTGVEDATNNKLVGFGICFPSFSNAMQKTRDGHFLPFGWWHLLKVLKFHKTKAIDMLLIGVLPEYRAKGANSLIFRDIVQQMLRHGYVFAEAMPQMETNTRIISLWDYFEHEQHRRHRCYKREIL